MQHRWMKSKFWISQNNENEHEFNKQKYILHIIGSLIVCMQFGIKPINGIA